jgi:very-short-patch-repair endonuclease
VTFPSRLRRQNLKTTFASKLREEMTDAERRLWAILRSKQVGGLKFRRQQPIGPYIVDFFCPSAKLVIELDGDQHGAIKAVDYDKNRTCWLVEHGYQVLRFPNADALKEPLRIAEGIVHHCKRHDIPLPGICGANSDPPSRGG